MKPLILLVLLSFGVAGCSRTSAQDHAPEPTPAAVFKAQRGVQFSATAAHVLGLQSAEVGTHEFSPGKAVTAVPTDAVLHSVKGDFVYVANGGWYLRTPVKTGTTAAGWTEIADGLYEGDRIVTHGVRSVWLTELQAVNGGVGCADGH